MTNGSSKSFSLIVLTLIGFVIVFASLFLGRFQITFSEVINLIGSRLFGFESIQNASVATILFDVRLPRVAAAFLIGGALSLSGAAYQGLFRNPMVSPDLLGASAGAGFGAAMAILLSWNMVFVQLSAFIFGLMAVVIAFFISKSISKGSSTNIIMLVLAGILVSTIFSSCISITKLCADPDNTLPAITFWLMGGLTDIRTDHFIWLLSPLLLGAIPLLLIRWKFNILSFGDEEAQSLGLDVGRIRLLVICCATLLTSASVAMCGMIGFVGLMIPHMARLLFGTSHEIILPASILLGGIFLVIVDDISRCAFPVEIPLGILCSLVGAPFFLFLLAKGRSTWL